MDGVILVVEAERTKIEVVRKIRKDLESTGVHLLGVVLNKKKKLHPGVSGTFPIEDSVWLLRYECRIRRRELESRERSPSSVFITNSSFLNAMR